MQKPVDTGRGENPASPMRLEREFLSGTHLRGRHYGQRSFVPHQQVEHMAAPTSFVRLQFALAKGGPSTQGELLPDEQGGGDRQFPSDPAIGNRAAG
jgi:hypothetical protein